MRYFIAAVGPLLARASRRGVKMNPILTPFSIATGVILISLLSFFLPSTAVAEVSCPPDNPSTNRAFCEISKPNVTAAQTAYPSVHFRPGDRVLVFADGCVQTSGSLIGGRTWKHYVFPTGGPVGFYAGQIRIPGATPGNGVVPIADVIGRLLEIPQNVDPNAEFLTLGYLDDNYSDNGYDNHDNGTDDQCKGEGPAFLKLYIAHRDNLRSYGSFSCGSNDLTYDVTSLSTGEHGGVRCVKPLVDPGYFIWYGEGVWGPNCPEPPCRGGQQYRHVGIAYSTTQGIFGTASDIHGNGEVADNTFPGTLQVSYNLNEWPVPRDIRVTGPWNEKWTLVSKLDHRPLPPLRTCGEHFDQYAVSSVPGGPPGSGVRCMFPHGPIPAPGMRPWVGSGDWSGTTYFHLGLYDDLDIPQVEPVTGSADDLCSLDSSCSSLPLRALGFNPVAPRGFVINGAWHEVWR